MKKSVHFLLPGALLLLLLLIGIFIFSHQTFSDRDVPDLPEKKIDLKVNQLLLRVQGSSDEFDQEGVQFMSKYLLQPSEKLNSASFLDTFGRCPSGAHYQLLSYPTNENPYFFGRISLDTGCGYSEDFFDFRVRKDGKVLEISDLNQNNYVPYKEWFKTAKPIF